MSSSPEVEIKFRVADVESLSARLRQVGLKQVTPRTHEMNILFDLPGRPLRARGDLLRLRKYGESWVLTHKAKGKEKDGPHKTRIETETRLEDGKKMEGILRALHFEPCFRYEKFRAEWKDEQGYVVIDETPIGNFAEIKQYVPRPDHEVWARFPLIAGRVSDLVWLPFVPIRNYIS